MFNRRWAKAADLLLVPDDAVAFTAPPVYDISIWQTLCPLLVGGRVVVSDEAMRLPRRLIGHSRHRRSTRAHRHRLARRC